MHAPECSGAVYGCAHCDKRGMTIEESWEHAEECHPESITTTRATPEQMAHGLAMMAELRAAAHDCMDHAVPCVTDGPLGHGWECGVCGAFLQAG